MCSSFFYFVYIYLIGMWLCACAIFPCCFHAVFSSLAVVMFFLIILVFRGSVRARVSHCMQICFMFVWRVWGGVRSLALLAWLLDNIAFEPNGISFFQTLPGTQETYSLEPNMLPKQKHLQSVGFIHKKIFVRSFYQRTTPERLLGRSLSGECLMYEFFFFLSTFPELLSHEVL